MVCLALAALLLSVSLVAPASDQDQNPLLYEWLGEADRNKVVQADKTLTEAHLRMCGVMIDVHAAQVERNIATAIDDEVRSALKRRCAEEALINYLQLTHRMQDLMRQRGLARER